MKILIVKTSALGDIVQAFPVLNLIHAHFPTAMIDWVVESSFVELIKSHPLVHRVFKIHSKKWRRQLFNKQNRQELKSFKQELQQVNYDWIFDLQGNIKSACVTALAKGKNKVGFGFKTLPEWPNMFATSLRFNPPSHCSVRENYLYLIQSAFKITTSSKSHSKASLLQLTHSEEKQYQLFKSCMQTVKQIKIMICPGSNWANKQLSQVTLEHFLNAIQAYQPVYFIFVWGTLDELAIAQKMTKKLTPNAMIMEKLSFAVLQNCMNEVDCIISMDSLPLHLAATTKTPTYSIFGPSSAQKYQPQGNHHASFQSPCPYGKTFDKRCAILRTCETGNCMKKIDEKALINHFLFWWDLQN